MKFEIPQPLKVEHEELHEGLRKATFSGGMTGEAAKAVATLMHPHFEKEEEYALPPLGIVNMLASGKVIPEMEEVLDMTDRLKADLPAMLDEHKQILSALDNLARTARSEKKLDVAVFAEKMILHARTEEEVSYPTAILVGEYVRSQLGK